jgi:hypothetical protein
MGLDNFFQAPPENFFSSEKVEYDVIRSGEEVAVAIQDISADFRGNAEDAFTNKEITPAVFGECFDIPAFAPITRSAGDDPYTDIDFQATVAKKVIRLTTKLEDKIARAREMMAAQVLTTGKCTLVDAAGKTMFTADFKPKSSHFFAAGTAWNAAGATIAANILTGCDLVRTDGQGIPDTMIMGTKSYEAFISDSDIRARLNNDYKINNGAMSGLQYNNMGLAYRGVFIIGDYTLDIYTYNGRYDAISNGASTKFLPDAKVVIMPSTIRLDKFFGSIPRFNVPDGVRSAIPSMPRNFRDSTNGRGLSVFTYFTPGGRALKSEMGVRCVYVPTAIDQLVCISTGV